MAEISAEERRKFVKFGTFIEPVKKDFLAQIFLLKICYFFVIMQIYGNYMHKLHFNLYKIHFKVFKLKICFCFVANLFGKLLKKKNIKLVFQFLMYSIVFWISYVFPCFLTFVFFYCFLLLKLFKYQISAGITVILTIITANNTIL